MIGDVSNVDGSSRSGCIPSLLTLAEIGTMALTRSEWLTASSSATPPPMLCPRTAARSMPRWSSSATTSDARFGYVISRSMFAVRPCPCISTPTTVCVCARVGMSDAKLRSMVSIPPCSSTSGAPDPYVS